MARRSAMRRKIWAHRALAAAWAAVGIVSFPLHWANSVVLVWIASVYANVASEMSTAEAADDRAVVDRIDRVERNQKLIIAKLDALLEQRKRGPR